MIDADAVGLAASGFFCSGSIRGQMQLKGPVAFLHAATQVKGGSPAMAGDPCRATQIPMSLMLPKVLSKLSSTVETAVVLVVVVVSEIGFE